MNQTNDYSRVSEIEIRYNPEVKYTERIQILTSQLSYEVLLTGWDNNLIQYSEEFKVLLLSNSNHLLGVVSISKGGTTATVVDAKMVFGVALKTHATGMILAHNHPSGNLQPSEMDKRLTQKLKQAGELLDIKVLDHIILSTEGFYSFADEGMI